MKSTTQKSSQTVTSAKPTTLNLQTRPFAPTQTETSPISENVENSQIEEYPSSSANILERLISIPTAESSTNTIRKKHFTSFRSQKMPIQAKLNIGEPNDKYEQEADATAARVVEQINASPQNQSVQKQESMESEEEQLQMKPIISSIQRDEAMEEEDEDGELQMKSLVQRRENVSGGEASTDLESSIQGEKGSGQSLDANLQAKMGQAMGADFSGVKVHTDSQSDQLNKSIQAKAFTTGQDVFFRQGAYDPSSRGGQELIAHELTHVVQQTGNRIAKSSIQKSQGLNYTNHNFIQRAFHPVDTTSNAHLRNDGNWKTMIGAKIPEGSEIVADKNQQKTQKRSVLKDVSWVKAVNADGAHWTQAHKTHTTYIRSGRLGQDKTYPQKTDSTHKPPRRGTGDYKLNWHEDVGEFVEIEDSVSKPGSKFAYIISRNEYKSIVPGTGVVSDLDAEETLQTDVNLLEAYLFNKLKTVMTNASNGVAWQSQLVTDENAKKVMDDVDGSKALRFKLGKQLTNDRFIAYYKWVTNPSGPFDRIKEGTEYVRDSLEHWREWLYPPSGAGVNITSIKLTGSDLHESGLGVMFVKFNKTNAGGNTDYPAAGEHELVVKPEERILEQKLFGTEDDSLANTINNEVGLAGPDQISTYKQKVDAGFGTLCEKVVGTQAKDLPKDTVRPITQALKESLVFVLITGLTDLHGENVLWDQGKPFMIDADNALKLQYMVPDQATAQNGYVNYSSKSNEVIKDVYASKVGYETEIMKALQNPGTAEQALFLKKVKEIFSSSVGRTVPIETAVWGSRLQNFIITPNAGLETDVEDPNPKNEPTTRWQWCDRWANSVPDGKGAAAPGLLGEVGTLTGTNGNFQQAVEKKQLHADFTVGQIPFYNYRYLDGKVLHNGKPIWDGQTITQRMNGLFTLFPNQINT